MWCPPVPGRGRRRPPLQEQGGRAVPDAGARWAYRHGLAEPAVDRENLDSTEDRVYLDGPARFALRVGTPHRGSTKAICMSPRSRPCDRPRIAPCRNAGSRAGFTAVCSGPFQRAVSADPRNKRGSHDRDPEGQDDVHLRRQPRHRPRDRPARRPRRRQRRADRQDGRAAPQARGHGLHGGRGDRGRRRPALPIVGDIRDETQVAAAVAATVERSAASTSASTTPRRSTCPAPRRWT